MYHTYIIEITGANEMAKYLYTYDKIENMVYRQRGRVDYDSANFDEKKSILFSLFPELTGDDISDLLMTDNHFMDTDFIVHLTSFIGYPKSSFDDLHKCFVKQAYRNLKFVIRPLFETAIRNKELAMEINAAEAAEHLPIDNIDRANDIRKVFGHELR